MVSFKAKKRSDTKNLLVPRRTGGLFQSKRGGGSDGLLLRSDDDGGGNDDVYERVLANGRIGVTKMPRSSSTGTPPQPKDPPSGGRSDVTPPLSPESDDEDDDEDDDAVSSYLQFEAAALDPPGHKLVTVSTTSNSLVQNLLSMMDKACVAPMEGEWGSGAASVASSSADDAPEWSAAGVVATTSDEEEFPIAAPATGDSSKLQHYLEPQRGEKHESFEMILREKTPPRKKTLAGLKKALLHLPNLFPGGDSHGADSNGGTPDTSKSKVPKGAAKKSPLASLDRKKSPATKRQERAAAARRQRDTEGRFHKPLTPISEPIPVEEEKKEEEDRFLQLPPAPRAHSRKIDAAMAAIPKTIQTAPPITRHFSKEARYKQVLGSWMSTRTPLETITEDENRHEGGAAEPTVRVPGIRNPDKYLSQSDLIGEDVQSKASSDASPVATHNSSSGGAGAETNSDIDQMDPQPASPIRKSRTWVGKWLGLGGLDGGDGGAQTDALSRSLSRQRSAPGNLTPQSSSVNAAFPKQRLWKAVVCEDSGRTYYYHRVSRRTTWTKPPEDEMILANAKAPSHVVPEEDEIKQVRFPVLSKETEAALLVKRQILAILHDMGQDATSVDKLLAQFEGREVELLDRLRSASEDQPFDELVSQAAGGVDESFTHSEPSIAAGSSARSNLAGRSRTQSSFVSGFSSALMSASTQPIRNTGIGRIFAAGNAADVTPDVHSHATSISSKQGDMLPPAVNAAIANPKPHDRVPSNIPVPRARELHVEEFNYKREEKRHKGVIRSAPPKQEEVEATSYFGDNDDTDTKETDTVSPNDSISALSEADLSFTNVDQQRRQALDEAIEREDWDLAAELSESLRATKTKPVERKREWTQTELDRFISSNDWDAVANYIAQVRSGTESGVQKDGKVTDPGRGPQKRFGAKSQLQHKSISVPGAPDEGWESASYSSYESEYSSSSSDTYEELLAARKREKFAC